MTHEELYTLLEMVSSRNVNGRGDLPDVIVDAAQTRVLAYLKSPITVEVIQGKYDVSWFREGDKEQKIV